MNVVVCKALFLFHVHIEQKINKKLTKNWKTPGLDNIYSELYKYTPEQFKLRLLQFLNNIYRENCIPDEWRNAVITPIFKKGDRREPKTTEELVFLTHAIRYTLKSLT